jgi:hypothetical protein
MATANDPISQHLFTPRVLWLALMMSNVMIFTVVTLTLERSAAPYDPVLFIVFGVASLASGVVHFVLPGRMRKQIVAGTKLETTEAVDPNASVIFREAAPRIRVFVDERAVASVGGRVLQVPFIVGMALAESIGMYGTVLIALGCPIEQAAAFPAIAALLMVRLFPTRKALLAPIEAHYGARLPSDQPAKSQ